MRSAAIILSIVTSVAIAAVVSLPSTVPLPLGELGWQGVVISGGPEVEVWGASFEDIEAKIREQYNPEFSIYTKEEQKVPGTSQDPALVARGQLERRMRNRNCNERFGDVGALSADDAIRNLRRIAGNQCKVRARTCVRTQCISTAGVGICNDNHHELNVPCTGVADMAENISRHCTWGEPHCDRANNCFISPYNMWVKGQIFSNGLTWNVIIGSCGFFSNGERPIKR